MQKRSVFELELENTKTHKHTVFSSWALESAAPEPLGARIASNSLLRTHLAHENTAQGDVFEITELENTAQGGVFELSAATGRSNRLLRNRRAFENTAQGDVFENTKLENTAQGDVFKCFWSHWALEIAAPSASGATGNSKSLRPVLPGLLKARNRSLATRNRCAQSFRSQWELELAGPSCSGATQARNRWPQCF
jgi:hypothetical protein